MSLETLCSQDDRVPDDTFICFDNPTFCAPDTIVYHSSPRVGFRRASGVSYDGEHALARGLTVSESGVVVITKAESIETMLAESI